MAGVWKRDGTVTVTSGSKRVIGVGTTFAEPKNGVAKGHIFTQISGSAVDLYEVDYVVSNTELYLVQAFRGTTASGAAYAIITTFSDSIPEFSRKLTATLASYQEQSDVLQLLYTSDTAEITVTAPDGTAHKLIPWKRVTSEGEGQAARAKVEADRAKTEADKAAQVVIDSAVPFPDVWIPFNDSLRMFAGYGREVKVGDDVVARMVNFERSTTATYIDKSGVLRTAAINEPRFEKQGFLIEGQSANIVKFSSNRVWANGFSAGATLSLVDSTDPMTRALCPKILRVGSEARYGVYLPPEISSQVTVGTVYTLTMRMRRLDAELGAISINGASGVKNSANSPAGVWTTRTITFTADVATVWPLPPQGEYEYAFIQLEALPFASSYIPTNGAAVTRAADKWFIPNNLNCGGINESMSLSLAFTCLGYLAYNNIFSAGDRQLMIYTGDNRLRLEQGGGKVAYITSNGVSFGAGAGNLLSISTGAQGITTILNGVVFKSSEYIPITGNGFDYFGSSSPRPLFGHIKNLRIWHHALSDAQLRGLK